MSEPLKTSDPPEPPAHDDREIDARSIVRYAIGFVVMMGVVALVSALVSRWMTEGQKAAYPRAAAIVTAAPTSPPEPRLQPSPPVDLALLRAQESRVLDGYGWIDRDAGVVSIPIERAIELTAERGLPARAAPPPATDAVVPSNATLGERRSFR